MTEQEILLYELYNNKYVEQGEAHRIWDLFQRAAKEIESLENCIGAMDDVIDRMEQRLSRYKEELSKLEEYEAMYKDLCK